MNRRTRVMGIRPVLSIAIALVVLSVLGCNDIITTTSVDQPTDIQGVMQSMKTELGELSSTYPELSDAGDINIITASDGSSRTVAYRKNCTFRGKMGYEDTGANACAVALRVMTGERFQKDVREVAMPAPDFTWTNLKLVGWTTLHLGKQPSPGFEYRMRQVISRHVAMINDLDAQKAPK
ncbi:MAG: hypothetical protein QGH94_13540 [Phycisphaerae bacterium]|nr:hypothetical protein [Phycisphaerae bacterium]